MKITIRQWIAWELPQHVERIQMWVAWHLPKWLVKWATVRLGAHATTGKHSNTVVPDLTFMDALQRWDK